MIDQPEYTLAFLGLILLATGFMLWRSSSTRQRIARQDPLRELQQERREREQSPESLIHEMEVRLLDFGREVEGRVETTLTVLDRLIIDAEQEIHRLEDLLKTSQATRQQPQSLPQVLSAEQRPSTETLDRIPALLSAGLTDTEIARCLGCDLELVRQCREWPSSTDHSSAA